MSSRQGANSRPHISHLELLSDDVTTATAETFKSVEDARAHLDELAQGVKALAKNQRVKGVVNREYVLEALKELAEIRDAAAEDIRALAIWTTVGDGRDLGITETKVAGVIGASNSTVNRWNKAGVVTWEESADDLNRIAARDYEHGR